MAGIYHSLGTSAPDWITWGNNYTATKNAENAQNAQDITNAIKSGFSAYENISAAQENEDMKNRRYEWVNSAIVNSPENSGYLRDPHFQMAIADYINEGDTTEYNKWVEAQQQKENLDLQKENTQYVRSQNEQNKVIEEAKERQLKIDNQDKAIREAKDNADDMASKFGPQSREYAKAYQSYQDAVTIGNKLRAQSAGQTAEQKQPTTLESTSGIAHEYMQTYGDMTGDEVKGTTQEVISGNNPQESIYQSNSDELTTSTTDPDTFINNMHKGMYSNEVNAELSTIDANYDQAKTEYAAATNDTDKEAARQKMNKAANQVNQIADIWKNFGYNISYTNLDKSINHDVIQNKEEKISSYGQGRK